MAAGLLIPVIAGVGLLIATLGKKKKQTETPMAEIEGADAQMAALYSRLMDPTKTNIPELEQGAAILRGNGHNEWAGNVYSKISSLQAQAANQAASAGAAKAAAEQAAAAAKAAGEAKAEAAKKQWEQAAGGRPSEAQLSALYDSAMAPELRDIGQLQYASSVLTTYGRPNEGAQVRAKIAKLQSEGAADAGTSVDVTTPGGAPVVDDSSTAPTIEAGDEDEGGRPDDEDEEQDEDDESPLAKAETTTAADPVGSIKLARNLITAETTSNWKSALQPEVRSWQLRAGLVADGKFGPKSALRMGTEVGILPRIRYWSKTAGTKQTQVSNYRSQLNALADRLEASDPKMAAHAAALRISAVNEDGAGYPNTPKRDPNATTRAKEAADAVAETEGSAEQIAELKELLKLGPEGLAEFYRKRQAAREYEAQKAG